MTLAAGTKLGPYDPPSLARASYGAMSLRWAARAGDGARRQS
jgi:hypothetical protein